MSGVNVSKLLKIAYVDVTATVEVGPLGFVEIMLFKRGTEGFCLNGPVEEVDELLRALRSAIAEGKTS